MFELSQETKENILSCVGMPFEEIYNWNYEAEYLNSWKIIFSKNRDLRKSVRGNPLLAKGRIRTIEYANRRLQNIKK